MFILFLFFLESIASTIDEFGSSSVHDMYGE